MAAAATPRAPVQRGTYTMSSGDGVYTRQLKGDIGEVLPLCLCDLVQTRPRDPIEFIAYWLYKYADTRPYFNGTNEYFQTLQARVDDENHKRFMRKCHVDDLKMQFLTLKVCEAKLKQDKYDPWIAPEDTSQEFKFVTSNTDVEMPHTGCLDIINEIEEEEEEEEKLLKNWTQRNSTERSFKSFASTSTRSTKSRNSGFIPLTKEDIFSSELLQFRDINYDSDSSSDTEQTRKSKSIKHKESIDSQDHAKMRFSSNIYGGRRTGSQSTERTLSTASGRVSDKEELNDARGRSAYIESDPDQVSTAVKSPQSIYTEKQQPWNDISKKEPSSDGRHLTETDSVLSHDSARSPKDITSLQRETSGFSNKRSILEWDAIRASSRSLGKKCRKQSSLGQNSTASDDNSTTAKGTLSDDDVGLFKNLSKTGGRYHKVSPINKKEPENKQVAPVSNKPERFSNVFQKSPYRESEDLKELFLMERLEGNKDILKDNGIKDNDFNSKKKFASRLSDDVVQSEQAQSKQTEQLNHTKEDVLFHRPSRWQLAAFEVLNRYRKDQIVMKRNRKDISSISTKQRQSDETSAKVIENKHSDNKISHHDSHDSMMSPGNSESSQEPKRFLKSDSQKPSSVSSKSKKTKIYKKESIEKAVGKKPHKDKNAPVYGKKKGIGSAKKNGYESDIGVSSNASLSDCHYKSADFSSDRSPIKDGYRHSSKCEKKPSRYPIIDYMGNSFDTETDIQSGKYDSWRTDSFSSVSVSVSTISLPSSTFYKENTTRKSFKKGDTNLRRSIKLDEDADGSESANSILKRIRHIEKSKSQLKERKESMRRDGHRERFKSDDYSGSLDSSSTMKTDSPTGQLTDSSKTRRSSVKMGRRNNSLFFQKESMRSYGHRERFKSNEYSGSLDSASTMETDSPTGQHIDSSKTRRSSMKMGRRRSSLLFQTDQGTKRKNLTKKKSLTSRAEIIGHWFYVPQNCEMVFKHPVLGELRSRRQRKEVHRVLDSDLANCLGLYDPETYAVCDSHADDDLYATKMLKWTGDTWLPPDENNSNNEKVKWSPANTQKKTSSTTDTSKNTSLSGIRKNPSSKTRIDKNTSNTAHIRKNKPPTANIIGKRTLSTVNISKNAPPTTYIHKNMPIAYIRKRVLSTADISKNAPSTTHIHKNTPSTEDIHKNKPSTEDIHKN